jgi:hypothetical protein
VIQPPARIGRSRERRVALLVVAFVAAVPIVALLGRGEPSTAAASPGPATPTTPATPKLGGATGGAGDASPFQEAGGFAGTRLVVALSPGPIAVAAGFGHVWVASGGDDAVRRFDPDGAIDRPVAKLSASHEDATPEPVIGLAQGSVWVAGMPGPRDLVELDAGSAAVTHRYVLPAAATGICGGLGAAWIVTKDQRLIRVSDGRLSQVLGPSRDALHIAIGRQFVWLSRGGRVSAIRPSDGHVVQQYRGGGGPIAVDDGSVWAVSPFSEAFELVRVDEASGRVVDRAEVSTSGYAGIAWALPTIHPTDYADVVSTVAPRSTISAIVGSVIWVGRPVEGELWRIDRTRSRAPAGATTPASTPAP